MPPKKRRKTLMDNPTSHPRQQEATTPAPNQPPVSNEFKFGDDPADPADLSDLGDLDDLVNILPPITDLSCLPASNLPTTSHQGGASPRQSPTGDEPQTDIAPHNGTFFSPDNTESVFTKRCDDKYNSFCEILHSDLHTEEKLSALRELSDPNKPPQSDIDDAYKDLARMKNNQQYPLTVYNSMS